MEFLISETKKNIISINLNQSNNFSLYSLETKIESVSHRHNLLIIFIFYAIIPAYTKTQKT